MPQEPVKNIKKQHFHQSGSLAWSEVQKKSGVGKENLIIQVVNRPRVKPDDQTVTERLVKTLTSCDFVCVCVKRVVT